MVTSGQVASMTRSFRAAALARHLRRDAVGREDGRRAVGHLVELLHEAHAAGLEVAHDVAVVDDLAADVDGALEAVEGEVHDLDGAHDARAEAAGRGEEDPLDREGGAVGNHGTGPILSPAGGAPRGLRIRGGGPAVVPSKEVALEAAGLAVTASPGSGGRGQPSFAQRIRDESCGLIALSPFPEAAGSR